MRTLHSSAVSALIEEELKSVEAVEGGTATLRCQLSKEAPVEWRKGHVPLRPSNKYRMRQEGMVVELLIHDLDPRDAGDYTCVVGNQKTTAALSVNGKKSEITLETLERFCPSLPSSFLYIPSQCFYVLLLLLSSFHVFMLPCQSFPQSPSTISFHYVQCCVCVFCLLSFPQVKAADMHACFSELVWKYKIP